MSKSYSQKRQRYETQDINQNENSCLKSKDAHKKLSHRDEKTIRKVDDDQSNLAQSSSYDKDNHGEVYKTKFDKFDLNVNSKRYEKNESKKNRLTSFCKLLSSKKPNTSNTHHEYAFENVTHHDHLYNSTNQSSEGNLIVDQFNRGIKPDIVSSR